jgi:hypothetical protein
LAWIVKLALAEPPVPSVRVTSEIVTMGLEAAVDGAGMATTSKAAAAIPVNRRCTRPWKAGIRNGGKERSMEKTSTPKGGQEDSPFRGFSSALEQVETFGLDDQAT